ncbi:MAG: hypothetical protein H6732_16275 [Alphaproteobacteria bacterium]|nr:hypothetical protein [Alphaproteobacteria bacterium]
MSPWLLAGLLACGGGAPSPSPATEEPVAPEVDLAPADPLDFAVELAARVTREVDCTTEAVRYVCDLADLPGEAFPVPTVPETWLGVTIVVRNSRTIADGSIESESLARVTLSADGVFVGALRPSQPSERLALGRILGDTAKAAKGTLEAIEIPQGLADYLDIPPEKTWTLQREEMGWSFTGAHPARVFKVPARAGRPEAYVVVETAQGGAFVTIAPLVAWSGGSIEE